MAKRIQVTLVDDIDGSEAATTVSFSYEGKSYELDLSEENAGQLASVLAPYIAAARKIGRSGRVATPKYNNTNVVREWALKNGYQVSSRGRIPAEVQRAYDQAHP